MKELVLANQCTFYTKASFIIIIHLWVIFSHCLSL